MEKYLTVHKGHKYSSRSQVLGPDIRFPLTCVGSIPEHHVRRFRYLVVPNGGGARIWRPWIR